MAGPVVFVSDLGLRDEFVGVCHLVIARIAPDVRVVDLSHGVPPHDIQAGAMMLAHGMTHAGPYAVALGIVDPGVGPARRAIAVRTADGPRLVGPDNGLLSLAWRSLGGVAQAVTPLKVRRLRRLAGLWLASQRGSWSAVRIDVIGVRIGRARTPEITHLQGVG